MPDIEDTNSIYIPLCLPFMASLYRDIARLQLCFELFRNWSDIVLIRYKDSNRR